MPPSPQRRTGNPDSSAMDEAMSAVLGSRFPSNSPFAVLGKNTAGRDTAATTTAPTLSGHVSSLISPAVTTSAISPSKKLTTPRKVSPTKASSVVSQGAATATTGSKGLANKTSPHRTSAPHLDTLKIYAEQDEQKSGLQTTMVKAGQQGLVQEVWSLFATMEDSQRNILLQGLLERCTVKQTDFICGAMNLKTSKNALMGNTIVHRGADHDKLERLSINANNTNFSTDINVMLDQPKMRADYDALSKRSVSKLDGASTAHKHTPGQPKQERQAHSKPAASNTQNPNTDVFLKMLQTHENMPDAERGNTDHLKNATPEVLRRHIDGLLVRQAKYRAVFEAITSVSRETNFNKAVRRLFQLSSKALGAYHSTVYVLAQAQDADPHDTGSSGPAFTVFESTWLTPKRMITCKQLFRSSELLAGRTFNMYNVTQSEEYMAGIDELYAPARMECILSVPIVAPKTQQVIGVLEFINKESGSSPVFEAEDESMLQLISNFWVFVLNNTQLQNGNGQNQQMMQAFSDIASALNSNAATLDGLVDGLKEATCTLMRCEVAEFCTLEAETGYIRSFKPCEYEKFRIRLEDATIPGFVLKSGQIVNSYEPQNDLRFGSAAELKRLYAGIRNVLAVPIFDIKHKVTGVVQVINRQPESVSFDKDDERLLASFAQLVAAVVDQARAVLETGSELKHAVEMNNFYGAVMASAPHVVFTMNSEGWITMVNRPSEIARADMTTRIRLEEIFGDGEFKDNMQHVIATGRKMHIFDAEISICGITHSVNYFIAPCGGKSGEDEGPFIDKERFSGCAAAFNSLSVNDGDFVIFLEDITSFRRQSAAMSRALPAVPARRLIASESTFQPYYAALVAGAERKLTVVRVSFECDIVDEEWGSNMPSIVEMTNEFFALTNDVLEAEGGMRVGRNNHITAFFKHSPLEKNDDPAMSANRAIVCALKLQAPLSKWTQQYSRHCDLATTVALTSGKALVGLMGPLKQQSLSAYGPPIAFVEQLSALSKLYDIPILVDTNTRLALVPNIIAREVDTVMPAFSTAALEQTRVPEKLYEVVGIGRVSQDREESIVSYELGLKEYREQNWNSGMIQFKKATTLYPDDGAAKVMYNRCDFIQRESLQLPAAWDGTWPISDH